MRFTARSCVQKFLIARPGTSFGDISWNFEKFLVSKSGEILQRFAPKIEPDSHEVLNQIEAALAA